MFFIVLLFNFIYMSKFTTEFMKSRIASSMCIRGDHAGTLLTCAAEIEKAEDALSRHGDKPAWVETMKKRIRSAEVEAEGILSHYNLL